MAKWTEAERFARRAVQFSPDFPTKTPAAKAGVMSGIAAGVDAVLGYQAGGVSGAAAAGLPTIAGLLAGGALSGGGGGSPMSNGNGVSLEDVPRTDDFGDFSWFWDIASWLVPGIQESWGELPEQIRGYAQVHGGVVKSWDTGTARFWMFADGYIGTVRKSGVVTVWKPAKHIVIPRNPRVGTLIRGHKRTSKLISNLSKRAKRR